MTNDPREGLPSGSSALADGLCFGRFQAQREWAEMTAEVLTDADENPVEPSMSSDVDQDAEAGKRIHLIYSGEACPEATFAERERAEAAIRIDGNKRIEWLNFFSMEEDQPVQILREYRWWLLDSNGNKIYSGQTDKVWIRGTKPGVCDILLADLKGLWGQHDPARTNAQIRRYLALITATIGTLGYSKVRTAAAYLNQPAVNHDPKMVLYDEEALAAAVFEMTIEVDAITAPDPERTPGPIQCHRCKAKMICEKFLETNPGEALVKFVEAPVPTKEAISSRVTSLSDGKLEMLLPWSKALEHLAGMAETEARRRLRMNPDTFGGRYFLKPNSPRHHVTDVKKVFTRMREGFGVTADEIANICSVGKGDCTDLVRKKSGLKGKALDAEMVKIFDGATTPSPVSPSLKAAGD